jgi:hypothetical protein
MKKAFALSYFLSADIISQMSLLSSPSQSLRPGVSITRSFLPLEVVPSFTNVDLVQLSANFYDV